MAFLFGDSFDHYAIAEITQKWTQLSVSSGSNSFCTISAGNGRRSTASLRMNAGGNAGNAGRPSHPSITLPVTGTTGICGFAWKFTTSGFNDLTLSTTETSGATFLRVRSLGATQIWFRPNADGTVSVYRGTSLLATSATALSTGVTYFLEFKWTIDSSSGIAKVRANGVEILDFSGNTGSAAAWNEVVLGPPHNPASAAAAQPMWDFDDLYILDGSGSTSNDYLNDVRVDALFPNAAGNSSQWTRSTGADQWATIDEASTNGDSDYNSTGTVNNKDTLNFPDAPVAGADIFGVQVNMMARKQDAGSAGLKAVTRLSGTDYLGTEKGVSSTYSDVRQIWDLKPSDSTPWTDSDFNSAEFGYQKSA